MRKYRMIPLIWIVCFFNAYPNIRDSKSREKYNAIVKELLLNLSGTNNDSVFIKDCDNELNHKWIENSDILTDENEILIKDLIRYKSNFNNYYVDHSAEVGYHIFNNEIPYKDSVNPHEPLRMLALARYWNIINYYYPYKDDLDYDWDSVLLEFIPRFQEKSSKRKYSLLILELIKKIQDSHSFTYSIDINNYLGIYDIPI